MTLAKKEMLRYRTPKEIAKIAFAMSAALVTAAFLLGPKGALPLIVLTPGTIVEIGILRTAHETFFGGVIRFLASVPAWFVPAFLLLVLTNPKPPSDSAQKG